MAAWPAEVPRCEALQVDSYDVELELTGDPGHFVSRTVVRFSCRYEGASTFADLLANDVRRAVLNGSKIEVDQAWAEGRLALVPHAGENALEVEASFLYATDECGLFRQTLGSGVVEAVYAKCYPAGAARVFCCFDEPQLAATFRVSARVPGWWTCLANGALASRSPAGKHCTWVFAPSARLVPRLWAFCAGTFSGLATSCSSDKGCPLAVRAHYLPPNGPVDGARSVLR
jgi:aminopeptidase N